MTTVEELHASQILTTVEAEAAASLQSAGGGLLRALERLRDLIGTDTDELWARLAQASGRACLTELDQIETLEEALPAPGTERGAQPLLARELALSTLCLAQRREGELLRVVSVDPNHPLSDERLRARAAQLSPTGRSHIAASALTPAVYRRVLPLVYPEAIYGPLQLFEKLAVRSLVPADRLSAYRGRELRAVHAGLVTDDDLADVTAEHHGLPRYDGRAPSAPLSCLPVDLQRRMTLAVLERAGGRLRVLCDRNPEPALAKQLERHGGVGVDFEIATTTQILALQEAP